MKENGEQFIVAKSTTIRPNGHICPCAGKLPKGCSEIVIGKSVSGGQLSVSLEVKVCTKSEHRTFCQQRYRTEPSILSDEEATQYLDRLGLDENLEQT